MLMTTRSSMIVKPARPFIGTILRGEVQCSGRDSNPHGVAPWGV
jgi:hypothetical protein